MKTERKLLIGSRIIFAVIGDGRAVHFHVTPDWDNHNRSRGGIELHESPTDERLPDNNDCWLLNGPCCHDGSSLYAQKRVIPLFHYCCENDDGDYEPVWRELETFLENNVIESEVSDE